MKKFFCFVSTFLISITTSYSQVDSLNKYQLIEDYFEEMSAEEENEAMYELLEELLNNPKDLNEANETDLMEIPFIDHSVAKKIIGYRNSITKFYSVQELFLVDDISASTIRKILPFVIVNRYTSDIDSTPLFSNLKFYNRSRIYRKNDPQESNSFIGSDLKFYQRLMVSEDRGNISFLVEKDPGENKWNDYQSWHIELLPGSFVNQIIIGDYSVEFGQGLVIWRPYAFSKGSNIDSPFRRKARIIIPNKSCNEANYFRGVAMNLNHSFLTFTAFYSNTNRDATINGNGIVTSISRTGYHRTENEIHKKGVLDEKTFGGTIKARLSNLSVGFLSFVILYPNKIRISDFNEYKKQFYYNSLSYTFRGNNFSFNGEIAYNNKSVSTINSLQLYLSKSLQLVFSVRNYPRNFFTMYGNGVGENSGNKNEIGIYTGIKLSTSLGKLSFYHDNFRFPYTSSDYPFATSGNETLINFNSVKTENIYFRLKYKFENKQTFSTSDFSLFNKFQHKLRAVCYYDPLETINLKVGFEFTKGKFDHESDIENGWIFYQGVKYMPDKNLTFHALISWYDTDSYDTRLYMYENDLRGTFTNLAYYDEGYKWYVLVSWKPYGWLNFSMKYSNNFLPNAEIKNGNLYEFGKNVTYLSFQIDNYFE